MRVLGFAASLRKESLNRKLIDQALTLLGAFAPTLTIDHADFREFEMPVYNGDIEEASGIPAGAQALTERIRAADALVIAAPEYNGSISGAFKNAVDWVSRSKPIAFSGKPVLLLGASPGALGATKGLLHSRVPLEAMGAYVFPRTLGVPHAHRAFDASGELIDAGTRKQLDELLQVYVQFAKALSGSN